MELFIRRPVISIVITITIILAGVYSALNIPVLQLPQIESSSLVITTYYTGASAEDIQGFITEPIERVAMTVPGVDYVESQTTAGESSVTVALLLNEDSNVALSELSSRLDQIRFELPPGAEDPSVEVERADRPEALFYLAVDSDQWTRSQLNDYLSRQVVPLFSAIDGVQQVWLGGRRPAMRVWIDPRKLASLNLGADEIIATLQANNVIASMGDTENEQQQLLLQTNATLETIEEFEELTIRRTDESIIRLRDVAEIRLGEDRGDTQSRSGLNPTVFISIYPAPGANEISIGDQTYELLDEINSGLPEGMQISLSFDGTTYMRNALQEIFTTLFETVVLVGVVVLILMGSLRTAVVPLITIPISILGTVAAMWCMGFSLNLLTVLAVVLSVGLVVDDAIVVVENVARHVRDGRSRMEAALISSKELLTPIIAMTLTLAAVYAPIVFVSGLTGSMIKEFAFSLAIAVIVSGIVAITLSPIMSAKVISPHEPMLTRLVNRGFDRLRDGYVGALEIAFPWMRQILFTALVVSCLVVPFYMMSDKELAPTEDQGEISVFAAGPPGASLPYTLDYMNDVVKQMLSLPGAIDMWQVIRPRSGFGGVIFSDYEDRPMSTHEMLPMVNESLSQITGLRARPSLPSPLPTDGRYDVEMVIQSQDSYQEMVEYGRRIEEEAIKTGEFMYLDNNLRIDLPQARLEFDHNRITEYGMDMDLVSRQLSSFVSERYVGRFNADGRVYRVIPMIKSDARTSPEAIMDLQLKTPDDRLIPAHSMASLSYVTEPRSLERFNQQRSFRLRGAIAPGSTNDRALTALEKVADRVLPPEYSIDYAGVSRQLRSEGNSLLTVLAAAMVVVYLLLAIQFNSFRLPLVVLLGSVPLALAAALACTFVGLTTVNIYSQIGCVTLVGLIAKNGILMTEFASERQRGGYDKRTAILSAASVRLRPILMTTAATAIGHFPLVIVAGAGAEARNSIGIVLVTGMIIGTLLALVVLPCLYLVVAEETASPSSTQGS